MRDNPFNHLSVKLARFLSENFDPSVETSEDARRAITPDRRDQLDAILRNALPLGEQADTVQWVRNWQCAGLLPDGPEPMPNLAEISFDDATTLERKIEQYKSNDLLRGAIAQRSAPSWNPASATRRGCSGCAGALSNC